MQQVTYSYRSNPKMFKNNPLGFILALVLVPAFGLGLVILFVWWLKCKSLSLALDNDYVLVERGLLSKDRSELRMTEIRSVRVQQTFFDRIFDTGRIQIFTAGDEPEIDVPGMPDPNRVRELIKEGSIED